MQIIEPVRFPLEPDALPSSLVMQIQTPSGTNTPTAYTY
jgi:hypothetical protein